MKPFFTWVERNNTIGIFLLRLFIGLWLIYGVQDNIASWSRLLEFRDFLENFGFPLPLLSAGISIVAQFVAGIMIVLGWRIRYAAILMLFNFAVAMMVHLHGSIEEMIPALTMFFCSLLFLFQGAGKISIDSSKKYNNEVI